MKTLIDGDDLLQWIERRKAIRQHNDKMQGYMLALKHSQEKVQREVDEIREQEAA